MAFSAEAGRTQPGATINSEAQDSEALSAGLSGGSPVISAAAALTAHRRSLKALTGIRFFAASYVVIFHSRLGQTLTDHGYRAASNLINNGYLAVPLFFILSGFILAYTYCGQIETGPQRRRFFEARFARIWPVYAISLLISFPYPAPGKMLAILLMLQSWNPFDLAMAAVWNGVCWTLSCELLFYLLFPWLQMQVERVGERGLYVLLGGTSLVSILINSASRTLGYHPVGLYRWLPLALAHVPEFVVGVGLGNLFLTQSRRAAAQKALIAGGGLATYVAAMAAGLMLLRETSAWTSLIVPVFAVLLYTLAAEQTALARFLSSRLLLLGGGMSYALYLVQIPVKQAVFLLFNRLRIESTGLRLMTNWVVLLAVSYVLFRGVEDPVRKLLRGWFERIELRRSAAGR